MSVPILEKLEFIYPDLLHHYIVERINMGINTLSFAAVRFIVFRNGSLCEIFHHEADAIENSMAKYFAQQAAADSSSHGFGLRDFIFGAKNFFPYFF